MNTLFLLLLSASRTVTAEDVDGDGRTDAVVMSVDKTHVVFDAYLARDGFVTAIRLVGDATIACRGRTFALVTKRGEISELGVSCDASIDALVFAIEDRHEAALWHQCIFTNDTIK